MSLEIEVTRETSSTLVSVIVPTFNVAPFVCESVASIQMQTHRNLEIIAIDDGSTDGTLEILARLAEDDPRIRVIQHRVNRGLSEARNSGLDHAHGEFATFVDSDDTISPELVMSCLQLMVGTTVDFAVFEHSVMEAVESARPLRADRPVTHLVHSPVPREYFEFPYFAWLKFLRLEFVRANGLRFEPGRFYEDHVFHWEIGLAAKSMAVLRKPLYNYRVRPGSISNSADLRLLDKLVAQESIRSMVALSSRGAELSPIEQQQALKGEWYVIRNIEIQHLQTAVVLLHRRGRALACPSGLPLWRSIGVAALNIVLMLPPKISGAILAAIRSTVDVVSQPKATRCRPLR